MDSYQNKFKIPVNPEGGDYDCCIKRGSERLSKPINLPKELNGILLLEQYQNIVDSISIQIEECSKNRKQRFYITSIFVFTIFIPVFLVIYHKISLLVHIIMMVSIFLVLILYNLISYLKMEKKFDSVINMLNNSYLQNEVKLYKVNKPYGMGNYRYTLKRIYILYSNNYITPQNPPHLYYVTPQQQQQLQQQCQPQQYNNSLYPVVLTTNIISNDHENLPLIN